MEPKEIWSKIVSTLHDNPQEFPTTPKTKKVPVWFRAYSDGNKVYVESARHHKPISTISEELTESQFNKIYPIYLRRENGERISDEAKSTMGRSVYYYSLIHHLGGNEKIICRICWNDSDWEYPTKKPKKIEQKSDSFVSLHGYGQEEWLFRFDWLIDGKHYAFLQPIGKRYDKYAGGTYDIALYTYNSKYKEHWIGGINNVYVPEYDDITKMAGLIP